jgi:excisionase family DNA binding protein
MSKLSEKADWLRPKLHTVKEAAFLLNVSEKSVRRFLARGLLHASKAIRKKLIPREEIETFFERTK